MKKTVTAMLALSFCFTVSTGQRVDTLYYDKNENPATKKHYNFYRVATQDSDFVKVIDYSKSGDVLMTGGYKSIQLTEKTGPFYHFTGNRLILFELYEPSKYPELLKPLESVMALIPKQNDSLHLEVFFYKNLQIDAVGYRNSCCILHGTWIYFSRNGKEMTIQSYNYNKREGPVSIYYKDKLFLTGYFSDGKESGEWKYYLVDGKVYRTKTYLDGKRVK